MKLFGGNRRRRFDIYDISQTLDRPEALGLIRSSKELDLGTPDLGRNENITIIGSNSSTMETLVVKLKWRPLGNSSPLVTLTSRLHFSTSDNKCYESDEIETYEPQRVQVHSLESDASWRILQFGSRASALKLYITSPYRRTRLVFMGRVRNKLDGSHAFLRLTCIMNPTANVFDFFDQYDQRCVQQMYAAKQANGARSLQAVVEDLLLHDRHDQKCRWLGEYQLVEANSSGSERQKRDLTLWGFHCRQYGSLNASQTPNSIRTKRIYSYMINGQAYSVGSRLLDSYNIEFGFTSFMNYPATHPIVKPPTGIDWLEQVNEKMDSFELQVSDRDWTFTSKTVAKRPCSEPHLAERDKFLWFEVTTNDNEGFAWVSLDDEFEDTQSELEAIEQSRQQRAHLIETCCLATVPVEIDLEAYVLRLEDRQCVRKDLVGAKAASLAHLIELEKQLAGEPDSAKVLFRVPRGFATTGRAYKLLAEHYPDLASRVDTLELLARSDRQDELKQACADLVQFVKALEIPDKLSDQIQTILDALDQRDKPDIRFAVRSSSWGEDEDDMSAAGQLSSVLNVPNEVGALGRAIMECFASKFSPENIEYKRQRGMPLDMPMGVAVHEMFGCDKAGVLFTCDPTNGDPTLMTITANYGLGESVVSAQADPDSIRVRIGTDGEPSIDQITIGQKNLIVQGTDTMNTNELDKSRCCMSDDEILYLARVALRVKQFNWAQQRDIEWGILDGRVNLFQSRPVTGLETMTDRELLDEPSRPSAAERGYFSRANIGEVMPFAVTPLSLTLNVISWSALGGRLFSRLIDNYEHVPHCTVDVYYERYHAFFNLRTSVFLNLADNDANSDKPKSPLTKALELGMFGREMGPQPEIVRAARGFTRMPNVWEGPKFNWLFKSLIWFPMHTATRQRPVLLRLRAELQSGKRVSSPRGHPKRLQELFRQVGYASSFVETAWFNHIVNITLATKQNMALTALLSRYIQDAMQLTAATNKFLAISPDVISAEIPERVERMAQLIEAKGREELQRFVDLSQSQGLEYCRGGLDSNNPELASKFEDFLQRFGHRCYNEFELSSRSWGEEPEKTVSMIRMNCLSKLNKKADADQPAAKLRTIDQVIESLPALKDMGLTDRLLIKYKLAPRSQLLLAVREQTKDLIVLHSDIERHATRMLADELQYQLRIPDTDLIYYLFYDELLQICMEPQPSLVMAASRRRQMFKRTFGEEPWKYDDIFSDLTPNHLKQSHELDAALAQAPKLHGTPASSGRVQGRVCLVNGYKELHKVRPGSILLTHSTDIAFSPVFPIISGIITEVGGLISHGAVVAREYGLPSVIGIPNVTQILQDEEEIILDADGGLIVRLNKQPTEER